MACVKPRLVLHVDLQNTIILIDSRLGLSTTQALNSSLTTMVWGYEDEDEEEWTCSSPELSTSPPSQNAISYYQHLEKKIVKDQEDRKMLRMTSQDFTKSNKGNPFTSRLSECVERLTWTHPADPLLSVTENRRHYHLILPSFYQLLKHLYQTGRDFSVILRTFGDDAAKVLQSTQYAISGKHPLLHKNPLPIPVNVNPGKIKRKSSKRMIVQCTNNESQHKITSEKEIYHMMSHIDGICGFTDDFSFWQQTGFQHNGGKPLWIDPKDSTVQHIIFDDNMRPGDYSAIDLRLFSESRDSDKWSVKSIAMEPHCDTLVKAHSCQVNTYKAIVNESYFIEKLQDCESHFNIFHKS